ncbi:hypothetical protein [Hyphococcus sp.]|uniref:hypothetical protein n=1 Tax=Hyphococcus sp. TaxID=2038636 RepID=UPI003D0F74B1
MIWDNQNLDLFIAYCLREGFNPWGSGPVPIVPRTQAPGKGAPVADKAERIPDKELKLRTEEKK